jgi:hypothetical protein
VRLKGIPPNGPVHSYVTDRRGTVVGFKESKLYGRLTPPIIVDTLKPPPSP